jgi:hypothetical protein
MGNHAPAGENFRAFRLAKLGPLENAPRISLLRKTLKQFFQARLACLGVAARVLSADNSEFRLKRGEHSGKRGSTLRCASAGCFGFLQIEVKNRSRTEQASPFAVVAILPL